MRRVVLMLALVAWVGAAASAQTTDPVGPFVVDVRGVLGGLPTVEGWLPTLPANTVVPSRGFGFEGGAHVYPTKLGPVRIGFGAALTVARGTATATIDGTPDVVTTSSTLAPQVSFNFGHRLGWSHLSLGYGAAKVVSDASAVSGSPAASTDSGWAGATNFGGGARWFLTEHIGAGFDVRWHLVSSRPATATTPGAPRATLFQAAVGFSVH